MHPCSDRHGSPDQRGSSHAGDRREHGRSASVDRLVRRRQDESGHGRHPERGDERTWPELGAEKRRACDRGGLSGAGGTSSKPLFVKLDGNAVNVKGDVNGNHAPAARQMIDRIFNKQINECKSASSLCTLVLLGENTQNLNAIHTSNAIDTLGKRLSEQGVDTVDMRKVGISPLRGPACEPTSELLACRVSASPFVFMRD